MNAVLAPHRARQGPSQPSPAQLAAVGLRAFQHIATAWRLTVDDQLNLLGMPPRSTFYGWMKNPDSANLSRDTLERLSNILGIYKALQILIPETEAADNWVRNPNQSPLFGGHSALEHMLAGNVSDLNAVRRHLDAARGGGWS